MTQSTPTQTFTIGIKYDTEALNQLESQLEHIAELMDRINGRRYDAGMTPAVDAGAKVEITADSFKIRDSEGKVRAVIKPLDLKSAGIDSAKITKASHGDHLRQLVREEIRQFVNRESRCGGLFSTW
ncbi:hypothetical protein [Xenorhabdus hominickii]|uniref:Phage protein n=1 Tax=Xenorhabdus hominickii TaxID=351679 RepID=A0ABN4SBP0_XENHO|nr:hypothetical protein [Xenorhabdus hominickii]AOM42618.1 hypothetical protein A9255_19955 [Xenorhabdus hominickii]